MIEDVQIGNGNGRELRLTVELGTLGNCIPCDACLPSSTPCALDPATALELPGLIHVPRANVPARITQAALDKVSTITSRRPVTPGEIQNLLGEDSKAVYAVDADGKPVTQATFASRAMLLARSLEFTAQTLIEEGHSSSALRELRNSRCAAPLLSPATEETLDAAAQRFEAGIRSEILRLSRSTDDDPEYTRRAYNLAIWAVSAAEQEDHFRSLLAGVGGARLAEYENMMAEARERAGAKASVAEIVEHYIRTVTERHGYAPAIEVISGFDGTIAAGSTSADALVPGSSTLELWRKLAAEFGESHGLRLNVVETPGQNSELRSIAARLYSKAAERLELAPDTHNFVRSLEDEQAGHLILSGRQTPLVRAAFENLGTPVKIEACGEGLASLTQPQRILQAMMQSERYKLFIVNDNCSPQLEQHISREDHDVNLKNLAFFASHGDIIAKALARSGVRYSSNKPDGAGHRLNGPRELISIARFSRKYGELRRAAGFSEDDVYHPGSVVECCRTAVARNADLPKPECFTVVKPVRIPGHPLYDIGACSAVPLQDGRMLLLFKSSDNPSKSEAGPDAPDPKSDVFAAFFDPRTKKVTYLARGAETEDPGEILPVLSTKLGIYSKDGIHDPRATIVHRLKRAVDDSYEPEPVGTFVFAVAFDKEKELASKKIAHDDVSIPIEGAVTELFFAPPHDPTELKSLGQFGPDHHFKNIVLFPEIIDVDGIPSYLLMIRKLPSIQVISIPLDKLERICAAPEDVAARAERTSFWSETLTEKNVANNLLMEPELVHEGAGNPLSPQAKGQLAPGLPPIPVCYNDKKYFLAIYNSVPDFVRHPKKGTLDAEGRVVCAALLNYDNPWEVMARAPLPVLLPRTTEEIIEAESDINPRHANVAFCGGGFVQDGALYVVYTEGDTLLRCAKWDDVTELVGYVARHDKHGSELPVRLPTFE